MKVFFCSIFIVASFIYIQQEDYKDEINSFHQYCKDVESGFYPDFKEMKNECEILK